MKTAGLNILNGYNLTTDCDLSSRNWRIL